MLLSLTLFAAALQSQSAMTAHAGADLQAADARLNAQYQATMARARRNDALASPQGRERPSYRQALVAAQRAWLAFRDANCLAFGYEFRGGSAEAMARGQCLARVTDARSAELRRLERAWTPL